VAGGGVVGVGGGPTQQARQQDNTQQDGSLGRCRVREVREICTRR